MKQTKKSFLSIIILSGVAFLACSEENTGFPDADWKTVEVVREEMTMQVVGRGKVSPVRTFRLLSRSSSRIQEIKVDEGQAVGKGDCLVKLEPDPQLDMEWNSTKRKILAVSEEKSSLSEKLALQKKLFEEGLAARTDIELMERSLVSLDKEEEILKKRLGLLEKRMGGGSGSFLKVDSDSICLNAPFSGTVLQINKTEGEFVMQGQAGSQNMSGPEPILILADQSSFIINYEISELDITKIAEGQAVNVKLDAYPEKECLGKVDKISTIAMVNRDNFPGNSDQSVSYYNAEITLDRCSAKLKAGLSGRVEVEIERRPRVLQVPLDSVIKDGDRQFVYLKRKTGFSRQNIRPGLVSGEMIEVVDGLEEGDAICENPLQYAESVEIARRRQKRGWLERIFR